MPHSWNLSAWMDALGQKRKDEPDLIYGVQPVEIVGDHSAHAAPILAPVAWMGGSVGAFLAVYACASLTSRAPGGTYIREVIAAGAAGNWNWAVNSTPGAMANLVAGLVVNDMAPDPVRSNMLLGTVAALPTAIAVSPSRNVSATANPAILVDGIYVQPGSTFQIWFTVANTAAQVSMLFEDCLAAPRER
jgi:hypothetical protein